MTYTRTHAVSIEQVRRKLIVKLLLKDSQICIGTAELTSVPSFDRCWSSNMFCSVSVVLYGYQQNSFPLKSFLLN